MEHKFKEIWINLYQIKHNEFWDKYQVSHENIGSCIAEFNTIEEAVEYCNKG